MMKRVPTLLAILAVASSLTVPLTFAAHTVSGPPGLGVTKLEPPEPFFEHIRTNNRLNLRIFITNGTGRALTFQNGSAVFRDSAGAALRTSPISVEEFVRRSTLIGAAGFAGGSIVTNNIGGFTGEKIVAAVFDAQNRIVVAGTGLNDSGERGVILGRYLTNGVLDSSFDGNGLRSADVGYASAVLVKGDSNIVVSGTMPDGLGFFVRTYASDGGFISSRMQSFPGPSSAAASAVDSQGRVVVGGSTFTNGGYRFFLTRFLTNGMPDPAFGNAGIVIADFPTSSHEFLNGMVIDASDRVVVAGWATVSGQAQFALARYRASDGALDSSFSTDGRVLTTFPGFAGAQANTVQISPSGRILAAGSVWTGSAFRIAVARYDADGSLDPNFSSDGLVTVNAPTDNESATDLNLDVIGRIILTGPSWDDDGKQIVIVRLNGVGQLDPSLDGDGIFVTPGPEDFTSATSRRVLLLPGDDIVVAGHVESDNDPAISAFMIARFRPSGSNAVLPINSTDLFDLLDFPFFAGLPGQDFNQLLVGFDSKRTPSRVDVSLKFAEFSETFDVTGISLRVYEQNSSSFRVPLGPPPNGAWRASDNRVFGTKHASSRSQRFSYDIKVTLEPSASNAADPDCDPDAEGLPALYAGLNPPHPNYDPNQAYTSSSFPECRLAYGLPIFAAAGGTVRCVDNSSYDNFPVGEGGTDGNGVLVQHNTDEFLFYAHMARASVVAAVSNVVTAGDVLGGVGNSGSSSDTHLHIHHTRAYAPVTCDGNNDTLGLPTYFNNVFFPAAAGGPSVRQLRTALPPFQFFTIKTNGIPNTLGILHGPGAVIEPGAHDTLASPMRLRTPVSVRGSVARATGTDVADAGDTIEDVYRFTFTQSGGFSAQLYWTNGADLDMILYDQNLQPIQPAVAKTLASPEVISVTLAAGTYYLFVSLYDPAPGPSSANYRLEA
ncbi:MAG TPA: peptidoglycan DD-metalloendopeptidase family protein, partial [Candidatus Acidoferrum sp.]|nr:peptidoglycan DD-metalloendopeptidase family protein [Candidatus Acidoferrum sp.]